MNAKLCLLTTSPPIKTKDKRQKTKKVKVSPMITGSMSMSWLLSLNSNLHPPSPTFTFLPFYLLTYVHVPDLGHSISPDLSNSLSPSRLSFLHHRRLFLSDAIPIPIVSLRLALPPYPRLALSKSPRASIVSFIIATHSFTLSSLFTNDTSVTSSVDTYLVALH